MDKELPTSAAVVRSKYATLFTIISELSNMVYGEKPGTKFEEIVKATKELFSDGYINDYLNENLNVLFDSYSELLPYKVAQDYKKDENNEQQKLKKIESLLTIIIKDLNDEITDRAERIAEKQLLDQGKWLFSLTFLVNGAILNTWRLLYGKRTSVLYLWENF